MILHFLKRIIPLPFLLAGVVGLGGCLTTPTRTWVALPLTPEAEDLRPWWREFRDPVVDGLVREALQENHDIRVFAARMTQADARLRQAGAQLFPWLSAEGDYRDDRINRLGCSVSPDRNRSASIGMLLDWELDVWGRLRAVKRAASFEAGAARQDWLGAHLLLSAAVMETYLEILEQLQIRRLLDDQIAVNEQLRDLTELRFGQSLASIVDVLQQREQLEATLALVPPTEALLEEAKAGLALLLGRAPGGRGYEFEAAFPEPSPLPDEGLPSLLVRDRPDLQAIQLRMRAQDARVAEAMTDLLPRFWSARRTGPRSSCRRSRRSPTPSRNRSARRTSTASGPSSSPFSVRRSSRRYARDAEPFPRQGTLCSGCGDSGGAAPFPSDLAHGGDDVGGLGPMIFETSIQALFLVPMAISLGVGTLFSAYCDPHIHSRSRIDSGSSRGAGNRADDGENGMAAGGMMGLDEDGKPHSFQGRGHGSSVDDLKLSLGVKCCGRNT